MLGDTANSWTSACRLAMGKGAYDAGQPATAQRGVNDMAGGPGKDLPWAWAPTHDPRRGRHERPAAGGLRAARQAPLLPADGRQTRL